MRINTNVASMTALEANAQINKNLSDSLGKLSTGLRINKASDDASGMAIADKLRTQASSIGQGIANANSANAFVQIADKAIAEQSNILDIVKTKLMQATTSTTSADGRAAINSDIKALLTQFDAISNNTNYNGTYLLNGTDDFSFQIGEDAINDVVTVSRTDALLTTSLGGSTGGVVTQIALSDTVSVKETVAGTAMAFTLADAASMVNSTFAGSMQSLEVSATTTTLVANDAATAVVFDSAVAAGLMSETNDVYTFASATTALNIGGEEISFTVSAINADNDIITVGSTSNVTVSNASTTTAIDVAGATGSDNLSTIKGAGTLSAENARDWMTLVDTALTELNTARSGFGSAQNQVESALRNMMTTKTNLKAAESIIRDVDYAAESANFNKQNIIAQAGTYAISQANNVQQNVLKLLQ